MPGESFGNPCVCVPLNGGVSPTLQPYVVSLNSLHGIITLGTLGGITITWVGNTIYFASDGTAGLGTVTSVQAASNNSNLTVTGGPVTVAGTFTFDLAGNLDSISGLTMAADQMLYSTAADTFAATSLTAFSRTLLDDAAAVNARSTLGLVIGTDVQAFSQDLADFVSAASWPLGVLTLTSGITLSGAAGLTLISANITGIGADFTDNITVGDSIVVTNSVTAGTFSGNGASISNLNASNLFGGPISVAIGGTGIASYSIGDLLYASGATTLSKLADVAAGAFLRSGGVATAPVWSTTLWPNTLVTGDILYASSATQVSRLADVATTNALISGGVGVAPSWGKITLSHTTGIAGSGSNGDITALTALGDVTTTVAFHQDMSLDGAFTDASSNPGNNGDILTSTNTGTAWSNQIGLDTLRVDTELGIEGTITAGGVTGAQTINKPSGTVNFAAAASSLVVTNSLATTSHRVQCTVCTNDATAKAAACVVTNGAFTIYLNAAATGETAVYWDLIKVT